MSPLNAEKHPKIRDSDLAGFRYFGHLKDLLDCLHEVGTARDKAGNRQLFYDQYVCLLLLYFFNPIITSLRGIEEASGLAKVQKQLGVRKTSLGSLSESVDVFDPAPLREIVQELASHAANIESDHVGHDLEALKSLTAVDGTLLRALPRMLWALGLDESHRSAKMHLHFDVFNCAPIDATITAGIESEIAQFKLMLRPNRLYVCDRGFISHTLYRAIMDAGSSFVARIKENSSFEVAKECAVSPAAQAAGVKQDLILSKLGTPHHKDVIQQPLRLVVVETTNRIGEPVIFRLLTDRLDMDAELVALAYRYRWTIELFFRWFKRTLGCQHLISESPNGVAIQCYVALIASLLIVLWMGLKPNKRTWEMIQFYFIGWATLEELKQHLQKRQSRETMMYPHNS